MRCDIDLQIVYVLAIRESGYEDEIFVFRRLKDARAKVYAYFGVPAPESITSKHISDLEAKYFGKYYFTLTEQFILEGGER